MARVCDRKLCIMNKTLLFITSYPTRQCGIATFAQDLVNAMHKTFAGQLKIEICALLEPGVPVVYESPVRYTLNAHNAESCVEMAHTINANPDIDIVCIEHEFGLYGGDYGHHLLGLLSLLDKPFIVRFHTVLPNPDQKCLKTVSLIGALASKVTVMTQTSADILIGTYHLPAEKIVHIPHGTHAHIISDRETVKKRLGLQGKKVLSTFGLLSENKGLETGIRAMKKIAAQFPDAVYLILGKTHPTILAREGERYRERLQDLIKESGLENQVRFVNSYLTLENLLDYLAITDIYLFTSIDPDQAVSGTFVYAMSAGCPVIATSFVQAREMLDESCGFLIDFNNHEQLATAAIKLLGDDALRASMRKQAIEKTRPSIWENVALAHMAMYQDIQREKQVMMPNLPPVYLDHADRLTDEFGMIQFAKFDVPDPSSGYTLDDNARALITMCMYSKYFETNRYVLNLAHKYLNFIGFCQQPDFRFLNYVDVNHQFTGDNEGCNLEDSNGRAVWALGYLMSQYQHLPTSLVKQAYLYIRNCFTWIESLNSPRAIAFAIKGLHYYLQYERSRTVVGLLSKLATRLQKFYTNAHDDQWKWYEPCLTYGNAVLPEAMMMAWMITGKAAYKHIAEQSFEFLCSKTFRERYMKVINNRNWFHQHGVDHSSEGGEQPIEIAYTMFTLQTFYDATANAAYLEKMRIAFSWYLGNNHLRQVIYNPLTYGCYDGLETSSVNQNQGAESTVCYLMARLLMEQWNKQIYVASKNTEARPPLYLSLN
ncbi:mannosyltransferase [Chitinophaga costaii]|nr:mannosyltransferase [Chitinophaga costaii]